MQEQDKLVPAVPAQELTLDELCLCEEKTADGYHDDKCPILVPAVPAQPQDGECPHCWLQDGHEGDCPYCEADKELDEHRPAVPAQEAPRERADPWTIVDDWMQLFDSLRYAFPNNERLDDYQQGWNNALTVVLQKCRNRRPASAPKVHACPECKNDLRLDGTTWKCTICPFTMPGRFA